ncbi:hypothetical protein M885DRAFT_568466 [Pelagophyceae sp. CCMP2097]|nr:hypothetical protein M885DRAFT_568466 [Pelagophyceae sp. CCMP2097]
MLARAFLARCVLRRAAGPARVRVGGAVVWVRPLATKRKDEPPPTKTQRKDEPPKAPAAQPSAAEQPPEVAWAAVRYPAAAPSQVAAQPVAAAEPVSPGAAAPWPGPGPASVEEKGLVSVSAFSRQQRVNEMASAYVHEFRARAATRLVCRVLTALIVNQKRGILVIVAQDASYSRTCRQLMSMSNDDEAERPASDVVETGVQLAATTVVMNNCWCNSFPHTSHLEVPDINDRFVIFIGTPGKYLAMCRHRMHSRLMNQLDDSYGANSVVFITKGVVVMPVGSQEQNIFGTESEEVVEAVVNALQQRGDVVWGHGAGTKLQLLERAFAHLPTTAQPAPLNALHAIELAHVGFDHFTDYLRFANRLKLATASANPEFPVVCYYDTGLVVSVIMGWTVDAGVSLLTDRDGLSMLRDANQLIKVSPLRDQRGVYNFFIGDGACRLNGGLELAMPDAADHVESFGAQSMINLFIFNNEKWAIEDNLVGEEMAWHHLANRRFYDVVGAHPSVTMCESTAKMATTLEKLSKKQLRYVQGDEAPSLNIIIVRNLEVELPGQLLGDLNSIANSPEIWFLRETLGPYADKIESKIPIYGCSAFEYIQFLNHFVQNTHEGQMYQYVCGHTDIQAAHMSGFEQPEGRCVLFVNDVYGTNGLGEALRFVQSGLGGKQLIVFIWHPSIIKVIDNFHLHRPPMVWPSLGSELAKYYVRKDSDAVFVDFDGEHIRDAVDRVRQGILEGTPLIVVNMLPECERSFIALDIRAKA